LNTDPAPAAIIGYDTRADQWDYTVCTDCINLSMFEGAESEPITGATDSYCDLCSKPLIDDGQVLIAGVLYDAETLEEAQ
jgi:hypothetical protein